MTHLRPSVEVCSLSVLGDLIVVDESTASTIFAQLCGLDLQAGLCAIRQFQTRAAEDVRWLELLRQLDPQRVQDHPDAVMVLLTDGFGLYELDAIDIVMRLCKQASRQNESVALN